MLSDTLAAHGDDVDADAAPRPVAPSPALLSLPADILAHRLLLTRPTGSQSSSYLNRTDIIAFACTCKLAASIALPQLYTHLFVPSLPSLPLIFHTLSARPDLATQVRSLTVSRYFIESAEFDLVTDALRRSKVLLSPNDADDDAPSSKANKSTNGNGGRPKKPKPSSRTKANNNNNNHDPFSSLPSSPSSSSPTHLISAITSITHAHRRCDPSILANLPMTWFTRIALICENLTLVDLSYMPHLTTLGGLSTPMVFGFLDLARILRDRAGVFKSAPHTPVSAVIVLEDSRYQGKLGPEVYFISAMDWGKRTVDISGIVAMGFEFPLDYPLVPFSDLSGDADELDAAEQQQQQQHNDGNEPPILTPPSKKPPAKPVAAVTNPNKRTKASGRTTTSPAARPKTNSKSAKPNKSKLKPKKWTIRHALVQIQNAKQPRPWAAWLHSPRDLWLHFGIRKGIDPVFDFSRPATFESALIDFHTPVIRYAKSMLEERHICASAQVKEYDLEGLDPKHMAMQEATRDPTFASNIRLCIHDFDHLHSSLFTSLRKLVISSAFFITTDSADHVCSQMATGLPNLTDLSVLQVQIPIDLVLGMLDMLTRRTPDRGKPLTSLRVTAYVPEPTHRLRSVNSRATWPPNVAHALARIKRTRLSATAATRGHVRFLCIEAGGHGLSEEHEHWDLPMVAVHPGLVHGIEELRMFKLKMFIVPPMLSGPDAPSFVPVSHVLDGLRHEAITQRTLLILGNTTLRNLLIHGTGAHCLFPHTRTSTIVPSRSLLDLLPTCPNLFWLNFANDELDDVIRLHQLTALLRAHPTLVSLTISYTGLTQSDLADLARLFVVAPHARERIAYPCPNLRELEVNNAQARSPKDQGDWVSVHHMSLLPGPSTPALDKHLYTPTALERLAPMDFSALLGGPFSSSTAPCPKCGLLIEKKEHTRPAMEFAAEFAQTLFGGDAADLLKSRMEGLSMFQDLGADATACSRCGPRSLVVAGGRDQRGATGKMWKRVSSLVRPYMHDLV